MKRLGRFWPEILLLAAASSLLFVLCSCERLTPGQKAGAETAGAAVSTAAGFGPELGRAAVDLVLLAGGLFAGHKHGRRKERACKVGNAG